MKGLITFCKSDYYLLLSGNREGVKKIARLALVMAMLTFTLLLAACGSSEEKSSEVQFEVGIEESQSNEDSSVTESPVVKNSAPLECDGILFEKDAVIDGMKLGDCMVAAMLAAGTGTHRVESTDGPTSVVDFQWNPDFSMNVKGEQFSMVIMEDTGWVKYPETNWIQENASSTEPEVIVASGTIRAVRALSNPLILREYLAMSSTWTVVGKEPVPAEDAFVDVAWHLVPEGPINMDIVTLTDVGLWLSNDYLGAYYVGTGTTMGVSVTTSNTFLQWGGVVDIPDPSLELN